MEMGLHQDQQLKLTMTANLQQAISILQYSTLELFEYIQNLSLDNPLIEIDDSFYNEMEALSNFRKRGNSLDFVKSKEPTLSEFLMKQLSFLHITPSQRKIVNYIIQTLNEDGYFTEDLEDTASYLTVQVDDVQKALQIVQKLEPKGIGATNLEDCLAIQLDYKSSNEVAKQIVRDYLPELASNKWKAIASLLEVSVQEVKKAHQLIKTLHPKPGSLISKDFIPNYIVPDLFVKVEHGQLHVTFNDQAIPHIQINQAYDHLLQADHLDTPTQKYIQNKYKDYVWIYKSIQQRKVTLFKVMSAIVEKQANFFTSDPSSIKVLTLKEIAEKCGVHESTVSRATTNKYVQTPHGLYELKHFFSSGIQNQGGDTTSSHKIKHMIKTFIQNENKAKPFSDQQITTHLNMENIDISRRTVAKYREALGIPSSNIRRVL